MLSTDREEFEAQLSMLCAGFNVPVGDRSEAYWKGLSKMSLIEFARCVEFALGEEGPGKIPTTKQVWDIRRKLKAPPPTQVVREQAQDSRDHLEFYAHRLLLRHVMSRSGLSSTSRFVPGYGLVDCQPSAELTKCLTAKRGLIDWFQEPVREGDEMATPKLFIEMFIKAISAVSVISPIALHEWAQQCAVPRANAAFPPWMARPLKHQTDKPNQQLLLAGETA